MIDREWYFGKTNNKASKINGWHGIGYEVLY